MRVLLSCIVALALVSGCDANDPPKPSPSSAPVAAAGPKVRFEEAGDGEVAPLVARAIETGEKNGRRVLVYVGATWCEPCQRFHHAVERGELEAALDPITFVEFDLDRDADRLRAAGYRSQYIPLFALPQTDGRSSGKQIEGSIKGEGAVAQIMPRLRHLLSE
jgi:thiol-disulfide isomerase/thioredoxin